MAGIDPDIATEWVESLTEEEAELANSPEFINALQEQKEQLNGAALSAEDYDAALQSVKDAQNGLGAAAEIVPQSLPDAWESLKSTDDDELKSTREDLLALAEAGQLTEETFHETEGADTFLSSINESLPETIKWINELVSSSSQLESMAGQISKMSDLLADKKNGNVASASDLAGFSAEVQGLESWEEFERVMGSSKSSMEECQEAANKLATEFVNDNNFLAKLDETNKDYYETQLKNMGVENAHEVVTAALTQKKNEEAAATEYETLATVHNSEEKNKNNQVTTNLANATAEEILQIIQEGNVSDETADSLYRYALEKSNASNLTIATAADCNNLYNLVSALGVAGTALKNYAYLKSVIESAQSWSNKAMADATISSAESALKNLEDSAKKEIADAENKVTKVNGANTKVNSSGSSSSSGSSGSSGSGSVSKSMKETIDWINRKLTVLQKAIEATKAEFENLFTLKSKKNNLTTQIKQTTAYINALKKAAEKYKKYADKVNLSASLKKKVQSGDYNINDYSSTTADAIQKYQDYLDKYNDLMQEIEEQRTARTQLKEERYQLYVDDAQARIEKSQAYAELDAGNYKAQNKHLETQKKYLKQEYDYLIKIAKLNGDSVEVARLKAEYQSEIAALTKEEFDNIVNTYDNKSMINSDKKNAIQDQIDLFEAKGMQLGSALYTKQMALNNTQLDRLTEEKEKLMEQLASGELTGDDWYEAQDTLYNIDSEIVQIQVDNANLQKSINQLKFD